VSQRDTGTAAAWLERRGQSPFPFQRAVWQAIGEGRSGLLHAHTGAGKTLAVWLGALQALAGAAGRHAPPLTVLWITPMRALAHDTHRALQGPLPELAPHWTHALRSSDTGERERAAQRRRLPTLLVTTPESVSLLLARADAHEQLGSVRLVVVDEWHELLGNKRGVQVQLALARLRRWQPGLMTWGLSATIGDVPQALAALLGTAPAGPPPALVKAGGDKHIVIDTLLPPRVERFPWAGHMGLAMLPAVVQAIEQAASTLVFTNTRAQSERWYQALLEARPDWAGRIALHHGSLDRDVRHWVEAGLHAGTLIAVVCTSSLDLGVDFQPVERVLQIGSAKGVARLLQRAGRSGHGPGRVSRVSLVPTHSLELLEAAAARDAAEAGEIETPLLPEAPLDVLVQHLVTVALGGGFVASDLLAEVRSAASYAALSDAAWQWALDFVARGGPSLTAYPDHHRIAQDEHGRWHVPDARIARRHRQNIGTIVADPAVTVQFWSRGAAAGPRLGQVEESFIARFAPGDVFTFAGRALELVKVHDLVAYVRLAPARSAAVARWPGGSMALSGPLAHAMLRRLEAAAHGRLDGPEMQALAGLLAVQAQRSALPTPGLLLAETLRSREGHHLFVYPFAGRRVHLGLAALLAWRVAQRVPVTFSMAVNDLGFELLSSTPVDWPALLPEVLQAAPAPLRDELLASVHASDLARRRFRGIARVAGLIVQGLPGERRSARQLQASSSLFFDVFQRHDPDNQLLVQAVEEALRDELDLPRLAATLARLATLPLQLQALQRATPLGFPLVVEQMRERLSTETLADRVARMVAALEAAEAPGVEAAADPPEATEHIAQALQLEGRDAAAPVARPPRSRRRVRR
jgi:ATP-dependent Lhr-like helicase